MKNATIQEMALQMVIMDAIEKGATQADLMEFMKSDACVQAANRYAEMIQAQFA